MSIPLQGTYYPTLPPDPPGARSFPVASYLFSDASQSGAAHFENSAHFDLELPPGYTYTSQLGFLTAVPEPEHYALVVGLCLLAFSRLRRRLGQR